jgi:hypothetical protein
MEPGNRENADRVRARIQAARDDADYFENKFEGYLNRGAGGILLVAALGGAARPRNRSNKFSPSATVARCRCVSGSMFASN